MAGRGLAGSAPEVDESVSDQVCVISTSTVAAPSAAPPPDALALLARACRLAAIWSAVTFWVVGSCTATVMANDCGGNGGGA